MTSFLSFFLNVYAIGRPSSMNCLEKLVVEARVRESESGEASSIHLMSRVSVTDFVWVQGQSGRKNVKR